MRTVIATVEMVVHDDDANEDFLEAVVAVHGPIPARGTITHMRTERD